MGSYEIEINEVSGGGYKGKVIHLEKNGERVEIGTTSVTERNAASNRRRRKSPSTAAAPRSSRWT
jgi:hypothetical protein